LLKNVKVNVVMRQHNIWCVYVLSVWRCVPDWTLKLVFSRQIFRLILKYQISWKSVRWEPSCSMRTDGRTWQS